MRLAVRFSTVLCATLITAASALAAGQNGGALLPVPPSSEVAISGVYAKNAKLISTTIAKNNAVPKALTAPQMVLDPGTAVSCPASPAGKCVIQAEVTVQVASTVANNAVRLCVTLDGAAISGKCLAAGVMLVGKHMTMTLPLAQYGVAVGSHTMQSLVQADANATLGYYHVKYSVYK